MAGFFLAGHDRTFWRFLGGVRVCSCLWRLSMLASLLPRFCDAIVTCFLAAVLCLGLGARPSPPPPPYPDISGGVLLAKPLLQGCGELCEHFFLACAPLWYSHLAAGLNEEAAPVLFPVYVQHDVTFDPIQRNVGALGSKHNARYYTERGSQAS